MPGSSVTMARRVPVRRLNSVDLPTLGRPTITRDGSFFFMVKTAYGEAARWQPIRKAKQSLNVAHPRASGEPKPPSNRGKAKRRCAQIIHFSHGNYRYWNRLILGSSLSSVPLSKCRCPQALSGERLKSRKMDEKLWKSSFGVFFGNQGEADEQVYPQPERLGVFIDGALCPE